MSVLASDRQLLPDWGGGNSTATSYPFVIYKMLTPHSALPTGLGGDPEVPHGLSGFSGRTRQENDPQFLQRVEPRTAPPAPTDAHSGWEAPPGQPC